MFEMQQFSGEIYIPCPTVPSFLRLAKEDQRIMWGSRNKVTHYMWRDPWVAAWADAHWKSKEDITNVTNVTVY